MKAIKYLFIAALTISFSATAQAQEPTGTKADVDAVKKIISMKPADLDKQMKPFYKKNRKNAENLYNFGRAFYEAKDTASAKEYAHYALEASKNKYAPAFVLLGDIASIGDEGGAAAAYYDQAIYADPKFADAYIRYAMVYSKIDPRGASQKLEELKQNCPEISIDAVKGHIFMIAADLTNDRKNQLENRKLSYESYMKADINKLDKGQLNEFVRASYFTGHPQDAFRVAEAGLKLEPRNRTFNRMAMFSSYDLKNYDVAKQYINKYFNESDSVTASEYDHYYAALIHDALGEKDNATSAYLKALDLVNESSAVKRWDILKTLSDSYLKYNDYENAIKYFTQYVASKEKPSYSDEEGLADIYIKYAEAEPSKKDEYITKAVDIYRKAAEKYPNDAAYSYFSAGGTIHKLDPKMEKSLALGDYKKVVDILANKADRTKREDIMLKTSYNYVMFYTLNQKNVAGAKEYADKILAIDPNFESALKIKELK